MEEQNDNSQKVEEHSTIVLNGESLTESEFQKRRESLEREQGLQVVEIRPRVFKSRIQG